MSGLLPVHWVHQDGRSSTLRGQIGGLGKDGWAWCDQPLDWVSIQGNQSAWDQNSTWVPVTIPPNIPAKQGDTVRLTRIGDTWQVDTILEVAPPPSTTTTTGG